MSPRLGLRGAMKNLAVLLACALSGRLLFPEDLPLKTDKAVQVQSVSFSSRSRDWSAFCSYYADGSVQGSHLSGNPPFVHEENSRVDGAVIDEIFALAKAAVSSAEPRTRGQDPSWTSYETIDIAYGDKVFSIRYPTSPVYEKPSAEVLRLKEAILRHRIGGW